MTDRIRINLGLDLLLDDEDAMRQAAFERLREAWSSEDAFPYSSATDVPFDQVVNSLLADAVPLELSGCRRGALEVEVGERVAAESGEGTPANADGTGSSDDDSDSDDDENDDDSDETSSSNA